MTCSTDLSMTWAPFTPMMKTARLSAMHPTANEECAQCRGSVPEVYSEQPECQRAARCGAGGWSPSIVRGSVLMVALRAQDRRTTEGIRPV